MNNLRVDEAMCPLCICFFFKLLNNLSFQDSAVIGSSAALVGLSEQAMSLSGFFSIWCQFSALPQSTITAVCTEYCRLFRRLSRLT